MTDVMNEQDFQAQVDGPPKPKDYLDHCVVPSTLIITNYGD